MAYYGEPHYYQPPRDRYARPDYPEDSYHYSSKPYSGSHHGLDVVPRREDSLDSYDTRSRDYPPGDYGYEYGYGHPPHPRRSRVATAPDGARRAHSLEGRGYYEGSDYSHRPRHKHRTKHHDSRHHHKHSTRSSSSSRSPPPRRRKSVSGRDSSRNRRSHRSYSYSPSPTRRGGGRHKRDKSEQRVTQAVRAAVTAGAIEAFRLRKDPGEWTGDKGRRILTAAITAGGTDGLVDRDPSKHSKRHVIESTLAGLAANHFVNGSRSKSRSRSKVRGRSGSRGKVKNIAATGVLAAAGKEAYDRFRSRSRPRGRSISRDSYDSRGSSDRRPRPRSRSVTDYINRGIAALGLSDKDSHGHGSHRGGGGRHRSSRYSDYSDEDPYYYSDYDTRSRGSTRRSRHSKDYR